MKNKCSKCHVSKNKLAFPENSLTCKPCTEKKRVYDREYCKRPYVKDRARSRHPSPEAMERLKKYWYDYKRRPDVMERARKHTREWQKRNPEQHRIATQVRRARTRGNGGSFTKEEWVSVCEKYGNMCLRCGKKTILTIDHVVPLVLGGSNYIENIQPLCKSCNSKKGESVIDYRNLAQETTGN